MKRPPSLAALISGSLLITGLLVSTGACTRPDQTGADQEDTTQTLSEGDTAHALMNPNDRLVIIDCCGPDSVTPSPVYAKWNARVYFTLIGASSATVTIPQEALLPHEDTTKRLVTHDGTLPVNFRIRDGRDSTSYYYRIEVDGCPGQQRMMLLRPRMIVSGE